MNFRNITRRYMRSQVAALAASDPLWAHVKLVLLQLDGLLRGYNAASSSGSLTLLDLIVVNIEAEIGDITSAVDPDSRQPLRSSPLWNILDGLKQKLHCSAVVHVLPDMSDVLVAHNTWSDYSCMLRVYKHYTLNFVDVPPRIASFSSYPAELHSEDDFYLTPQLVVLETTNMVFTRNTSDIQANSTLLTWMRVILANALARNGSEWASIFKRYNSGSESFSPPSPPNNFPCLPSLPLISFCSVQQPVGGSDTKHLSQPPQQQNCARWVRLDLGAAAGMSARSFTATCTDARAPCCRATQKTATCRMSLPITYTPTQAPFCSRALTVVQGSWPSYNVPYFPTIREMSGVEDMEVKSPVARSRSFADSFPAPTR
jgi:hypothetical protein